MGIRKKKPFSAICFNSLQTKTIIPGCTKNTALLDAFIAVDIRRISRNFNLYDQKCKPKIRVRVRVMLFSATFNNISVISWRSVLLVDETGVPREDHRLAYVVFHLACDTGMFKKQIWIGICAFMTKMGNPKIVAFI